MRKCGEKDRNFNRSNKEKAKGGKILIEFKKILNRNLSFEELKIVNIDKTNKYNSEIN